MANSIKDSFLDLERHRQLLEENIENLKKSLKHWRTWEAEYEGLKEEIIAAGPNPSREQLQAIGRDYEGEAVTFKEVEDILGLKAPREADQVINILSRRIEYVQQNVQSLEKQLDGQERKLTAASIISNPEVRNEEGLPMTEIVEELDDDGNVIASHISTPGNSKSQLLEVLQKAGVQDISEGKDDPTPHGEPGLPNSEESNVGDQDSVSNTARVREVEERITDHENSSIARPKNFASVEEIPDELSETESDQAVIPADESPEEAALRKQMLEYGMSEVGSVVAQLDLEEGDDSLDDEGYDDGEYSSEDDDDEDQFGKSTRKVMTEDLRQQMLDLERRLGVRMMENVGPHPEAAVVEQAEETKQESLPLTTSDKAGSVKKTVRFAESLDISPSAESKHTSQQLDLPKGSTIARPTISDVVERTSLTSKNPSSTSSTSKVSRFKSSRVSTKELPPPLEQKEAHQNLPQQSTISGNLQDRTREVPTGPAGATLASSVVEREVVAPAVSEPEEFESTLLRQEVATEYHRVRNRLIQKQGGFKDPKDTDEHVPLEEEEGGPKRVSRFKAARLAKQ